MGTTYIQEWSGARAIHGRHFLREMAFRCGLAAIAVAVCYCFGWEWLRTVTADANTWVDALFGVHLQRLSFDTVAWHGQVYRYVIACTMADVWCGSLAFLWKKEEGWARNLLVLAIWTPALFAFNVLRLSFSDVLFARGLSWNLAHNVVSGVTYFAVWQVLWARLNRRRKRDLRMVAPAPAGNL